MRFVNSADAVKGDESSNLKEQNVVIRNPPSHQWLPFICLFHVIGSVLQVKFCPDP